MWHVAGPWVRPLNRWAEHSQRIACRNAMVASTALTARRRERDEAQEVVARLVAHRSDTATKAATPARVSRLG